jgi:hypothetical protein
MHAHIPLRFLVALVLVLCAPMTACSKQLRAETDYVEGTDFSKYQTYRWITDDLVLIQSGSGDPAIRTLENERRIRAAVDRGLAAKGLKKVDSEEAQLIVAFTVGTKARYKLEGGATQRQIWSAWTKKNLEPGTDPDTVIGAAVAALLSKLPR